jgi:hypothetical protein
VNEGCRKKNEKLVSTRSPFLRHRSRFRTTNVSKAKSYTTYSSKWFNTTSQFLRMTPSFTRPKPSSKPVQSLHTRCQQQTKRAPTYQEHTHPYTQRPSNVPHLLIVYRTICIGCYRSPLQLPDPSVVPHPTKKESGLPAGHPAAEKPPAPRPAGRSTAWTGVDVIKPHPLPIYFISTPPGPAHLPTLPQYLPAAFSFVLQGAGNNIP